MAPNTQPNLDRLETEPIVEVFTNPANAKILTVLTDAGGTPLTVADIIEQTDITKQAFYDNKSTLLEYNLIEPAEKVGNASRYKVDMTNDALQGFMTLRDRLIFAANK